MNKMITSDKIVKNIFKAAILASTSGFVLGRLFRKCNSILQNKGPKCFFKNETDNNFN